jgi:CheY-like chemotaxis protein
MTTELAAEELIDVKSGSRVMYVDDDPDMRLLIKFNLERERNDKVILCAPDFEQLQIAIGQNVPNLVILSVASLLDHGFQGMFDFCQQLQDVPVLQNVPVLLWSVYNSNAIDAEAEQLGIRGYTVYPHDLHALIAARDTLLRGGTYFPNRERA